MYDADVDQVDIEEDGHLNNSVIAIFEMTVVFDVDLIDIGIISDDVSVDP